MSQMSKPSFVGWDLAAGPDKTVFVCSICGIRTAPCVHATEGSEKGESFMSANNPHAKVYGFQLSKQGGAWLGAARKFLQVRAHNGERLIWGSSDAITGMTAKDIEEMAAEIAAAAINEHMENIA